MVKRVVTGALVVTGDGESVLDGVDVLIANGRVERIGQHLRDSDAEVLHARGAIVLPGLVNTHAHGVTAGPLMPSGGRPLPRHQWLGNLDRELLQGATAVLNLCGLSPMTAVRAADAAHPVRVAGATTHEPLAVRAAQAADGAGLTEEIRATDVAEQLALGAVAIGELGGGQTLAGGGQDAVYLPAAFLERHGVRVEPHQASLLKEAVLGRMLEYLTEEASGKSLERVDEALGETGLRGSLSPSEVVAVVRSVVTPSLAPALDGIREGIRLAALHGVPAFVHSAAVTASLLTSLAERPSEARIVACHVNHSSYRPGEAVELARLGRAAGWANEACVFDLFEQRELVTDREPWDALFAGGQRLVDLIATDYGPAGRHDGLLHGVRDLTDSGRLGLAEAVALVTSAPADLVPGLTPAQGRLVPGGPADLVVVEREDLAVVREVLIDGVTVARDGRTVYKARVPVLSGPEYERLESVVGTEAALVDEGEVAAAHQNVQASVGELREWMAR